MFVKRGIGGVMHILIVIVSWHHLVWKTFHKRVDMMFGFQIQNKTRFEWCVDRYIMSFHSPCLMIIIVWNISKGQFHPNMPKDSFIKALQQLPPAPIFHHCEYCWRVLRTWLVLARRMNVQDGHQVHYQRHNMQTWQYYHLTLIQTSSTQSVDPVIIST